MDPRDVQHAVFMANLQGAVLGLMREQHGEGDQPDGLTIEVLRSTVDGSIDIDLTWTLRGLPVGGEGV